MKDEPPRKGQKWKRKEDGKVFKVMAVEDNWVMSRIPGCVPHCTYQPYFITEYRKVEAGEEQP